MAVDFINKALGDIAVLFSLTTPVTMTDNDHHRTCLVRPTPLVLCSSLLLVPSNTAPDDLMVVVVEVAVCGEWGYLN
jgi:hypothetical protein